MNSRPTVDSALLKTMICNTGRSVGELCKDKPVFLVFLRHFGCAFCKEALTEIGKRRADLEKQGVHIVFVHMAEDQIADRYFNKFGLEGVTHISDPDCQYYASFGLTKGNLSQLFGLRNWMRGFSLVSQGYKFEYSAKLGDSFQMPGMFVIQGNEIHSQFVHQLASDKPDYDQLFAFLPQQLADFS